MLSSWSIIWIAIVIIQMSPIYSHKTYYVCRYFVRYSIHWSGHSVLLTEIIQHWTEHGHCSVLMTSQFHPVQKYSFKNILSHWSFSDRSGSAFCEVNIIITRITHTAWVYVNKMSPYSNSNFLVYCQYGTVFTVLLLWCWIDKYTNYC